MAKLNASFEQAKKYNQQEGLTGEEETDYDQVKQNLNDFTPFFELWTTVETWNISHKAWISEDFDKLDAVLLEETVDNAYKLSSKAMKVFRTKEMPAVLKIAETVRDKVQDFKPNVPIITSMRVDGMKDRHWDAISEKIGQVLKPYAGFTL
jgi:dynein heavy chain